MPTVIGKRLKVYDASEVAGMIGLSERSVRDFLSSGKIAGYKIGNVWVVPTRSLAQYIRRGARGSGVGGSLES